MGGLGWGVVLGGSNNDFRGMEVHGWTCRAYTPRHPHTRAHAHTREVEAVQLVPVADEIGDALGAYGAAVGDA
jgi:hypothetical protein